MPHALNLLQVSFILCFDIRFTQSIITQTHEKSLHLLDFLFFHTFFTPISIVKFPFLNSGLSQLNVWESPFPRIPVAVCIKINILYSLRTLALKQDAWVYNKPRVQCVNLFVEIKFFKS